MPRTQRAKGAEALRETFVQADAEQPTFANTHARVGPSRGCADNATWEVNRGLARWGDGQETALHFWHTRASNRTVAESVQLGSCALKPRARTRRLSLLSHPPTASHRSPGAHRRLKGLRPAPPGAGPAAPVCGGRPALVRSCTRRVMGETRVTRAGGEKSALAKDAMSKVDRRSSFSGSKIGERALKDL